MQKRVLGTAVVLFLGCGGSARPVEEVSMPIPSEEHELMSTRPRVAPTIEIDEALVVERAPIPEPPPLPECVPANVFTSIAHEPGALRISWNRGGNALQPDDISLWIGRDGSTRVALGTPAAPDAAARVTVGENARTAEVCGEGGACVALAPELDGSSSIQQAVVDAEGSRVALLLHDGTDDEATVEVRDARDGSLLARGERRWRGKGDVSFAIDLLGPAVLWVAYPGDGEVAYAELWKSKKPKLKRRKKLRHHVAAWGAVGDDRVLFVGDRGRAELWDMGRARRITKVDLGEDRPHETQLATAPGEAFVLITTDERSRVAFVEIDGRDTSVELVDVPRCA